MSFFPGKRGSYHFRAKAAIYDDVRGHTGEDYLTPIGTPIPSPADGVVAEFRFQPEMGWCMYIKEPQNGYVHVFAHLKEGGAKVKKGDTVKRGQIFALSGNTGSKNGGPGAEHYHYEVIAPKPWLGFEMMKRTELAGFPGFNIPPEEYLVMLEERYKTQNQPGPGVTFLANKKLTSTVRDGSTQPTFEELGIILERFLALTKTP